MLAHVSREVRFIIALFVGVMGLGLVGFGILRGATDSGPASGVRNVTVEGLEQNGKLHPVQVAFWENQGYQCGFCTPGQILGTVELLSKIKNPTEEQIRAHLSGHMCKCSAYPNIVKSVQAAAKLMT